MEQIEKPALTELEEKMINLKEQFGYAVDVSDEFNLYQQYRLEGETFIPKYLKILSYGGSESPAKILSEAGLDISSPVFWQGGFDVIKNMIAELEQLS